jgi:uracil-DNA glycosylase
MQNIHNSWDKLFDKHQKLINKIYELYDIKTYPSKDNLFKIFEMNITDIKLVFLGQDPYHGPNQAHGLAFSVKKDVSIPPSLRNIYKEIKTEYPEKNYIFDNGNLERWFLEEKIFLLNSSLTVFEGKPGIHLKKWTPFTDDVIKMISENNEKCVFLLLGNFAKKKEKLINDKSRIVLGVHPSPLSANRGFFGSNIFKEIDDKLGYKIDWSI